MGMGWEKGRPRGGYWVAARNRGDARGLKARSVVRRAAAPHRSAWYCEACNCTLQTQPQGSEYRTRKTRGDRGRGAARSPHVRARRTCTSTCVWRRRSALYATLWVVRGT